MRSVFLFFKDANEDEVAQFLNRVYSGQRRPWLISSDHDPILYIDFYRDARTEFEPENWTDLVRHFGGEPSVALIADVSGRHPGTKQVFEFVIGLLGRFSGSALDEYTDHLWCLSDLQADHHISGHSFFDYKGWHAEEKCDI
jgi:hypothetical protein